MSMLGHHQTGSVNPVLSAEQAIAAANSSRSVFISICEERATLEAQLSALRHEKGLQLSPLDGVPVAWKDNIDLKGTVTTGGTKVLGQNLATRDATLVNRLSRCGVINVGKTNMSELAYSGLGLNPHYGTPTAVSPGRQAPGGSSSGSAVAVARGIVPLAMGSDTAGSLRVPATFNGISAFRPSSGRHSRDGLMPLATTMDSVGFMAKHPEDIVSVERVLIPNEQYTVHPEEIAAVFDPYWLDSESISDEVLRSFDNYIGQLRSQGVTVVEKKLPLLGDFFQQLDEHGWLGGYEAAWQCRQIMKGFERQDFDMRVWDRVNSVADHRYDKVILLSEVRRKLMKSVQNQLGNSFLLMPTTAHTAPDLDKLEQNANHFAKVNLATLRLTMFGSFLDTPAFVMPTRESSDGQFCSVQWIAPQGNDERLLQAIETLTSSNAHNGAHKS